MSTYFDPREDRCQSGQHVDSVSDLMARVRAGGQMPKANTREFYGDFSGAPDFRQALDAVNEVNQRFAELPVKVKKAFGYDPAQLMVAMDQANAGNEEVRQQFRELGLLPKEKKAAQVAQPVEPPKAG